MKRVSTKFGLDGDFPFALIAEVGNPAFAPRKASWCNLQVCTKDAASGDITLTPLTLGFHSKEELFAFLRSLNEVAEYMTRVDAEVAS